VFVFLCQEGCFSSSKDTGNSRLVQLFLAFILHANLSRREGIFSDSGVNSVARIRIEKTLTTNGANFVLQIGNAKGDIILSKQEKIIALNRFKGAIYAMDFGVFHVYLYTGCLL